jgi:FkbM family methyltransferase
LRVRQRKFVKHARRIVNRVGFDVRRYDAWSSFDASLGAFIRDLDIRHVIDVGANIGTFGNTLRILLGFSGRIDSYEPATEAFAALLATAEHDPEWFTHHIALTNSRGSLTLNLFAENVMNSLSLPSEESTRVFPWWNQSAPSSESVEGRRLDSEDIPNLGPTLLKVDTQGHDWEVVEGAGVVLDRTEIIMVEFSFIPLYQSSRPAWEIIRLLNRMGFELALFNPISRSVLGRSIIEADGVFVRGRRGLETASLACGRHSAAEEG